MSDIELYEYTDGHNHQLVVRRAPGGSHLMFYADNLAYGGESVNVWMAAAEAHTFVDCLTGQTPFEHADVLDDTLVMDAPKEDWTVFTFTRAPRDDDEEPATVRVVFLTARLPFLAAAIKAGIEQLAASPVKEA